MPRHTIVKLIACLRCVPDPLFLAGGLVVVAAIAGLQIMEGGEVLGLDLFLIPVAIVAWFARSRRSVYGFTLVAAAVAIAIPSAFGLWGGGLAVFLAGAVRLALYFGTAAALRHVRCVLEECDSKAHTDHLTGVANVCAFNALAQAELERNRRYARELSLLYFDIDDFKAVNDEHGHAEGDRVLYEVGATLRGVVREVDVVARVGGDEFVVLMPETDADAAGMLADRLRQALAAIPVADGRLLTTSMGLVTFAVPPSSVARLLQIGDSLMYSAKTQGKNAVARATLRAAPEPCSPPTPASCPAADHTEAPAEPPAEERRAGAAGSRLTLPEVFAEQFGGARPAAEAPAELVEGRKDSIGA